MVRRILILASAVGMAGPAFAQVVDTATQRIDLAGHAASACVISQPAVSNQQNASYSPNGPAGGQITISQLVDSQSATSLPSSIQLNLPVVCNSSHQVVIRSTNGALVRAGAQSANAGRGFSQSLTYQLGVDWNGETVDLASGQQSAAIGAANPAKGDLTIRFATAGGGGPLVAGQYTDAITVELVPAN